MNLKIGVFDSGIGGTTVLREIRRVLPGAEYFYLADSENCPYGTKTDAELREIVTKNVEELRARGASVVVVACNTATTRCIGFLRRKFPEIRFIGTEPAIKLAAASDAKKILVLATPGTIDSERTHELASKYARPGQQIDLLSCPGLADTIERYFPVKIEDGQLVSELDVEEIAPEIIAKLDELLINTPKDYDAVVLGCTHYPLVKTEIAKYFSAAQFLDGSEGVARAVQAALNA